MSISFICNSYPWKLIGKDVICLLLLIAFSKYQSGNFMGINAMSKRIQPPFLYLPLTPVSDHPEMNC